MDVTRRGRPLSAFTLMELLFIVAVIAVLAAIAVPNFLEAQTRAKIGRTVHDMAVMDAALKAYYADHLCYPPNTVAVREWLKGAARMKPAITPSEDTPTSNTVQPAVNFFSYDPNEELKEFDGNFDFEEAPPPTPMDLPEGFPRYLPTTTEEEKGRINMASKRYTVVNANYPENWHYFYLSRHDLRALTTPVAYLTGKLPVDVFLEQNVSPFVYLNLSDVVDDIPSEYIQKQPLRYVLISSGPSKELFGEAAGFGSPVRMSNPIRDPLVYYDPTNGTISPGYIFSVGGDLSYENFRGAR